MAKTKWIDAVNFATALLGYCDHTDRVFQAGVLLHMGVGRSKVITNMYRDSRYPRDTVLSICRNFRANGVWGQKATDRETFVAGIWDGTVEGQIAFTLDAMCGAGVITRTN